jgi:glyoxylase-like metal-dependent hydrolase (beta-lactamase superfamily II)
VTTYLCKACGTQYPPSDEPPAACPICEDPRQYIPHDEGQVWLTFEEFLARHEADLRDDHGLLGIGCAPSFSIGQRALLVKSSAGNVLWDCQAYLDDEIEERIAAEGGLGAIAISHPHYYSTMVEWAHEFHCQIMIHELEREWVQRPDEAIEFWSGDVRELSDDLTLLRLGGHFAGGQVLHWRSGDALLSGDIVQVLPGSRRVSFMYSYPMLLPLPAREVERIAAALEPWEFDRIYGAWWGRVVAEDGRDVVRRSAERYVRALA